MTHILSNITAGSMALRFARDTIDLVSMQVCREEGKAPHHPETVNPAILLNALKNIHEIRGQLTTAEMRLNAVLDEVEVVDQVEAVSPYAVKVDPVFRKPGSGTGFPPPTLIGGTDA